MRIGVAKEIKPDEYRVALTPAGARELIQRGHEVVVETGAGLGSQFSDEQYAAVGAELADVETVWQQADLLLKVKGEETQPLEGEAAFNTARQLMRNDLLKAEAGIMQMSANMEAKYEGVYSKIMSSKPDEALAPKN